jgi:phosphatidylglycerol:prolipoprotein diacylglycerol transferase
VAFILFITLGKWRAKHGPIRGWQEKDLDDLLFYGVLGVVLGGRLGYVLFYKPDYYLAHPLEIPFVWQGGMSFHGGFLGVLAMLWYFGRRTGRSFLQVGDFVGPLVPLGLAAGRLGNFINGELWGRITSPDAWWAMVFPQAAHEDHAAALVDPSLMAQLTQFGGLPRHPSQLYQFGLEGVTLFVILWLFSRKARPTGLISAVFLIGYGCFRFIAEFARQPDDFLGLLAGQLSMGQWLSMPMVLIGIGMAMLAVRGKLK